MAEVAQVKTIFAGAVRLLEDCQAITSEFKTDCTIMGGWNALLYKQPDRDHPGTFDADLLLPPDLNPADARALISAFLDSGFALSAKHAFQLIRPVTVGGVNYAYNVDLLHPFLEARYPDMFNDLVNHGVAISDFDRSTLNFSKSIVLPGVDSVIWQHRARRTLALTESDQHFSIEGVFPSPAAFTCSKALALGTPKRPRDAYDIFLVLEGQGVERCARDIYEIATKSPTGRKVIEKLHSAMKDGSFVDSFARNDFFKKFPPEKQNSYREAAQSTVSMFLEATKQYPEGMEPYVQD